MQINADLPYPSVDNLTEDLKSAKIISPAYAGRSGELTAVLSYCYRHVQFDYQGNAEVAELLDGIAHTEMKHFELLAKTLVRLGANPVYVAQPPVPADFFNTVSISRTVNPEKMLMDAITEETQALAQYNEMLSALENEQVALVVERIVLDELVHLQKLKAALESVMQTPVFDEN